MEHFNDFIPVLLLTAPLLVPLEAGPGEDAVAGEWGGGEGAGVGLAPEAVEDKV